MHIPKNYFHDRLVLALLSINTFLAVLSSVLILLRLRGGNNEVLVQQYHANLGLSAFQTGGSNTYMGFIGFALLVLILHTALSLRTYHRRRDYSLAILWMGMLLLVLLLIVSNALSALR